MLKRFLLLVLLTGVLSAPLQAAQTIYGPITRQDTLWNLAELMRPSKDVTTQQVMMALYKKNPHAFTVNNISSLRKDAYMLAPTEAETKQIKRKTAVTMVSRHNKRWKKRRFVRLNAAMPAELKRKLAERDAKAEEAKAVAANTQTQPTATKTKTPAATEQAQTIAAAPEANDNASSGQQVIVNNADNAAVQAELRTVKQELEQTRAENQRLNNELVALKKEQKQMMSQSEANQEIQVQLDALRHELDELKTILAQKDNHIKVLQASLKDASQAIKSQHADNMRLYNKLKELSPESIAAAVKSNNTQAAIAKPQIKLAAVTNTDAETTAVPQEVDDSGIVKVWADELTSNSSNAEAAAKPLDTSKAGSGVTLSEILSTQSTEASAGQLPNQVEDAANFTLSISRSAAVSPVAWAAVLISFAFILFMIIRALLMQNELRRLEDS